MKPRHKRIALIFGGLASLAMAALFVLKALDSNIALYVTPSDVFAGKSPQSKAFRMGGLVKTGSIQREGMTTRFIITDTAKEIPVAYTGILPDLFRDGKGAIVQGRLEQGGQFVASEVLAKHDENYMPPEAADALKRAQKK
ncbi:MAG TPA: cytochrome c maturation protein CcmE [Rugosibacter sp.]